MRITRRIWAQLAVFIVISLVALGVMAIGYMRLPNLLLGVGHYNIILELPESGGLYPRGNVTYRGTEVGQVKDVHLTETGVEAVLSLRSDVKIPSDVQAEVHSQTAVGEQYVALLQRDPTSRRQSAARYQYVARRDQPWAASDSRRQPQDRNR